MAIPKEELKIGDKVWVRTFIHDEGLFDYREVVIKDIGNTFKGHNRYDYIESNEGRRHWCIRLYTTEQAKIDIKQLIIEYIDSFPSELLPENLRYGVNFVSTKGETT